MKPGTAIVRKLMKDKAWEELSAFWSLNLDVEWLEAMKNGPQTLASYAFATFDANHMNSFLSSSGLNPWNTLLMEEGGSEKMTGIKRALLSKNNKGSAFLLEKFPGTEEKWGEFVRDPEVLSWAMSERFPDEKALLPEAHRNTLADYRKKHMWLATKSYRDFKESEPEWTPQTTLLFAQSFEIYNGGRFKGNSHDNWRIREFLQIRDKTGSHPAASWSDEQWMLALKGIAPEWLLSLNRNNLASRRDLAHFLSLFKPQKPLTGLIYTCLLQVHQCKQMQEKGGLLHPDFLKGFFASTMSWLDVFKGKEQGLDRKEKFALASAYLSTQELLSPSKFSVESVDVLKTLSEEESVEFLLLKNEEFEKRHTGNHAWEKKGSDAFASVLTPLLCAQDASLKVVDLFLEKRNFDIKKDALAITKQRAFAFGLAKSAFLLFRDQRLSENTRQKAGCVFWRAWFMSDPQKQQYLLTRVAQEPGLTSCKLPFWSESLASLLEESLSRRNQQSSAKSALSKLLMVNAIDYDSNKNTTLSPQRKM